MKEQNYPILLVLLVWIIKMFDENRTKSFSENYEKNCKCNVANNKGQVVTTGILV